MKEIDFRDTRWGHNILAFKVEDNVGKGWLICTPRPDVDDVILWKTAYGHARGTLTWVEPVGDPHDMYRVQAEVTARVADGVVVSQKEIDEYFGK